MILVGITVVATPQAHAVADAVVSGTVVDSLTAQPLASVTVTDSTNARIHGQVDDATNGFARLADAMVVATSQAGVEPEQQVVPNLSLLTLGNGYGVLYNGSTGTVQMVADVLAYVL